LGIQASAALDRSRSTGIHAAALRLALTEQGLTKPSPC
jgi:hypothetical protein